MLSFQRADPLAAAGRLSSGPFRGHFSVGLGAHKTYRQHRQTIDRLQRAITQTRTVQMRYYTASRDRTGQREVDPYHLWYADGGLYLIGHCHLRQEVRMFAVDRIRSLTPTSRPCQMPLDFDLDAYVKDALVVMHGTPIEVELLFDQPTSAWVKGRQWHPSQQTTEQKDGRPAMTICAADTRELVGWVLHFGSGVQVISPASFRDKVRAEARKISEQA